MPPAINPVDIVYQVVCKAKEFDAMSSMLDHVRALDESPIRTLERVIHEYRRIVSILQQNGVQQGPFLYGFKEYKGHLSFEVEKLIEKHKFPAGVEKSTPAGNTEEG